MLVVSAYRETWSLLIESRAGRAGLRVSGKAEVPVGSVLTEFAGLNLVVLSGLALNGRRGLERGLTGAGYGF